MTTTTQHHLALADRFAAHDYNPLPVVLAHAQGAWVTDVEGRRFLDCLAGYSATNFGHRHPLLMAAARDQMERLTLTGRAFHNDRLGPFCEALAGLTAKDAILPMNTGAEAVETAIKTARRWGTRVKEVPDGHQRIVVAAGNFHGRTTTIVGFSSDRESRDGFGPFTPGFDVVPYGDAAAVRAAIGPDTVGVLLEPIQGEAGVIIPPVGYLREVRAICDEERVLFIADEIQSGLGRTGTTFACDVEQVKPDIYVLGKALGGGILPVSAIAANVDILDVITPGSHGSTFGGNPLASAVGHEVVRLLETGDYQERARRLGARLVHGLESLLGYGVVAVRGRGLWAGVDVDPSLATGRQLAERLLQLGLLVKDTHGSTVRLSPPLVIERDEVDWLLEQFALALATVREVPGSGNDPVLQSTVA
jgi:ornithine--oxo-acid transaminase